MKEKLDNEVSRRTFLKGTAAAGAFLLGPGVPYIAKRAWAEEENKMGWHGPYPYKPPVAGFNEQYENAKILKTYGKSNAEEIRGLVPDVMIEWLKDPVKWGPFYVNEMEYIKYVPTPGYVEATNKYKGTCKLAKDGNLLNWVAGLPFENPQNGWEVAWNYEKRCSPDDYSSKAVTIINERGTEKRFNRLSSRRLWMVGRTTLDPKPVYPNDKGLELLDATPFSDPNDLRGMVNLYHRYVDRYKADDMWLYIPTMRRIRRMSTAQRMDSIGGGSDATWDDFLNFSGKMMQYDWKLIERRDALLPTMAKGKPEWVVGRHLSGVNDRYRRLKGTYIVECIPKDPNHIYSKKILWVDPESFHSPYGEFYDRKGKLWKIWHFHIAFDSKGGFYPCAMTLLDIQRMHSSNTVIWGMSGNDGWTEEMYTWSYLEKVSINQMYPRPM